MTTRPSGPDQVPPGQDQPANRQPGSAVSGSAAGRSAPPATSRSSAADVASFLNDVRALAPVTGSGRGRLMFAMDATLSRRPTWDLALGLQADMFNAVHAAGGLDVQLVYFRGSGECAASRWVSDAAAVARLMATIDCRGGHTQIGKVLGHAAREAQAGKVNALVYVGDAMEEPVDAVCSRAGKLALLGVPMFVFQEGHDPVAETAFRELARLTKGAFCRFDRGSAQQLRDLLSAVAVFAAGGRKALQDLSGRAANGGARLLLAQLPRGTSG